MSATINLMGGLGNQLFQIFFMLNLGKKNGINVYFPNKYKLDKKRHTYYHLIPSLELSNASNKSHIIIKDDNFTYVSHTIDRKKNYYFEGYYQSYLYLLGIDPLKYIKIHPGDERLISQTITVLRSSDRPLVSLHVRRGDYLLVKHFHNILGLDYYKNAIKMLEAKDIIDPMFVIFSDDLNWCKDNFGFLKNKEFISEKDYIELFIMSRCDHHILANSSFSWWGAYLNTKPNKIVIYPDKWFEVGINTRDLCPPDWLKCKVDKKIDYGFIVPTCLLMATHVDALKNCVRSIRNYHPEQLIVIIKDFTSVLDIDTIFANDPNIIIETDTPKVPADMLTYYYFKKKRYFQKAITIQDSMEILNKFDVSKISDINYVWHFTNHRVHWSIIKEPLTEYNKRYKIVTHNDLLNHCIKKYINITELREYCFEMNAKKDKWVGCFGCLTIMDIDFLDKLDSQTDIIRIMSKMLTNRMRRVIESIFSLCCQYVYEKIPNSFQGLIYDGYTQSTLRTPLLKKLSYNRNNSIV